MCLIDKENISSVKTIKLFLLLSQMHFGFILILSFSLSVDISGLGIDFEINMFEVLVSGLAYVDSF